MNPLLKSFLSAIVGGVLGGSTVTVTGGTAKEIAVSAGASAVVSVINLWLHKPGTEPPKY
jgi:hypothetical protein